MLLGYGTFSVEAGGQVLAVIDFIPFPEQLYLEVYQLLYPREEEEEDEDDSGEDGGPGGPGGPAGPGLDFDDL